MKQYDLSFVFPCLNEAETIPVVIQELKEVVEKMDISSEIILSDNGSIDDSVKLAEQLGCRIIHATQKGYGEALKKGFQEARGKYIAFADIDGSYPLKYLPKMYQKAVDENADMVVASRTKGRIEKGAMPFLHRWLGTPVLTGLINFLFRGKLSDCNSGFRLFKKEAYEKWQVHSSGMEFASELLIKALKNKAKIVEIPAGLRPDKRSRAPHLKTWRDGMRHLLFILSESPQLFERVGLGLIGISTLLEVLSILTGPVHLGQMVIFDYHSKLILLGLMMLGLQSYLFSGAIYVFKSSEKPFKITSMLLALKQEILFSICIVSILFLILSLLGFVVFWAKNTFHNIDVIHLLLDVLYGLLSVLMFSFGLIQIHLLKCLKVQSK